MTKSKLGKAISLNTSKGWKKYIFLFLLFLYAAPSYSQASLRGSMGILFQSTPSITDYLNLFSNDNPDFSSAAVFSLEGGYRNTENTEIGLEVAYLIYSTNVGYDYGQFEFAYGIIMPTVYYYYVISGKSYNFKFGAGAGPRFVRLEQKMPGGIPDIYTSTGYGFVLKADGNTSIGGNFYANIGADIKYDMNGEPKNNGTPLYNNIFEENVNFNSFSVGVRLGITYQF